MNVDSGQIKLDKLRQRLEKDIPEELASKQMKLEKWGEHVRVTLESLKSELVQKLTDEAYVNSIVDKHMNSLQAIVEVGNQNNIVEGYFDERSCEVEKGEGVFDKRIIVSHERLERELKNFDNDATNAIARTIKEAIGKYRGARNTFLESCGELRTNFVDSEEFTFPRMGHKLNGMSSVRTPFEYKRTAKKTWKEYKKMHSVRLSLVPVAIADLAIAVVPLTAFIIAASKTRGKKEAAMSRNSLLEKLKHDGGIIHKAVDSYFEYLENDKNEIFKQHSDMLLVDYRNKKKEAQKAIEDHLRLLQAKKDELEVVVEICSSMFAALMVPYRCFCSAQESLGYISSIKMYPGEEFKGICNAEGE
jgi:hypothetical protein